MTSEEPPRSEPDVVGSGARRRSIAELDARFRRAIAGIDDRLGAIDQRGSELAGAVAELLPRVHDLADRTFELGGRLDALAEDRSGSAFAPVHWPSLSAEEAADAWDALGDWVEHILGPWYGITRGQLPDCWALHRRSLIELSWLRSSYVVAFGSKAPASLAAEWHTRWLRDALGTIKLAIPDRLCRPSEHLQAPHASGYAPPPSNSSASGHAPGRHYTDPRDEVIGPQHWRPSFVAARNRDISTRQSKR
jgi:hypothetical protein